MKVLGYCRVSTIKKSNGTSLEYQSKKIKDFCQFKGLELTEIFNEVDSGGNDDRVVLQEIRHLIESDKVSILLIAKIDRLGRTMMSSLRFKSWPDKYVIFV